MTGTSRSGAWSEIQPATFMGPRQGAHIRFWAVFKITPSGKETVLHSFKGLARRWICFLGSETSCATRLATEDRTTQNGGRH